MRATTLLNRVFDLPGVRVTGVDLGEVDGTGQVVVEVALRARLLACPACSFTTSLHRGGRGETAKWERPSCDPRHLSGDFAGDVSLVDGKMTRRPSDPAIRV